ncbi:hypothetical protein V6N12_037783 [Hibiscus sabdariffa]|uniref:Uncharacterized protein n=1 Tax=Hibiscus sabdariffa TaxID=183260 RepID=A0ABR2B1A2_9ROSI
MPVSKTESDSDCCSSIPDWARNRKRRREDVKKENGRDTVPTASTCSRRGLRHLLSLCVEQAYNYDSINSSVCVAGPEA